MNGRFIRAAAGAVTDGSHTMVRDSDFARD
jgi:hypothetical protein